MKSAIERSLRLAYPALGLFRAAEPAPEAKSLKKRTSLKGGWGCAMFLLARAFRGETIAYSGETCHCPGAASGLGLTPPPLPFPGGLDGALRLLSCGNALFEEGRVAVSELREAGAGREVIEEFEFGEGFKKTPGLVLEGMKSLPRLSPNPGFLIAGPLEKIDRQPEVVIFLANGEQLSALNILANYARASHDNVIFPFAAGCMSIGIYPLGEIDRPNPRAVVGLADMSARHTLRRLLGTDLLSFSVPWALFSEMEGNAGESFLSRPLWARLAESQKA